MNTDKPPRLIADAMLGRLSRRLRMMGLDTLYEPHIQDAELVRLARAEDRIILTRDTGLMKRKGVRAVFVAEDDVEAQIPSALEALGIKPEELGPARCGLCNGTLRPAKYPEEVEDLVPEHVFHTERDFHICAGCCKIYWKGTHLKNMERRAKGSR